MERGTGPPVRDSRKTPLLQADIKNPHYTTQTSKENTYETKDFRRVRG